MRQPSSPRSAKGSSTTATPNPAPDASAYMPVANARAHLRGPPRPPRCRRRRGRRSRTRGTSSCAPVKTSNVGESADRRLAAHAPTSPTRIRRRRPQRSASAVATSETSTPARVTARATPRAWSDSVEGAGHRVGVLGEQRTREAGDQGRRGGAARRLACSGVNGTGGSDEQRLRRRARFGHRSPPRSAGRRRGGARRRDPSHALDRAGTT